MKRPNADEIARWLMDDTLVMRGLRELTGRWITTENPMAFKTIRVSIATVEGNPVFVGNTYYDKDGNLCNILNGDYDNIPPKYWTKCTLTPPKPKSILDSDVFDILLYECTANGSAGERIKQFLRYHKGEI